MEDDKTLSLILMGNTAFGCRILLNSLRMALIKMVILIILAPPDVDPPHAPKYIQKPSIIQMNGGQRV